MRLTEQKNRRNSVGDIPMFRSGFVNSMLKK